jgi:ferredoxin-NADP reductase
VTPDGPAIAPSRWREATIERIVPQTARVVSVFLRVPLARHVAGQHLDIRLTAPDGYQAQRSYSIASAPGNGLVELAIERLDNGEVSPYFHEIAQPGDTIEARGPIGGHFIWRAGDGGPILLIAGGSGVVPLASIVRDRAIAAPGVEALLAYSARRWEELIFRDELLAAGENAPGLTVVVTTTREPRRRPDDFERRLDRSLLRDILARWNRTPQQVYVCGANGFVEAVTRALVLEGLPPARIRAERYGGAS